MALQEIITRHPTADLTPSTESGGWYHSHEYNRIRYGLGDSRGTRRQNNTGQKNGWLEQALRGMNQDERKALIKALENGRHE